MKSITTKSIDLDEESYLAPEKSLLNFLYGNTNTISVHKRERGIEAVRPLKKSKSCNTMGPQMACDNGPLYIHK